MHMHDINVIFTYMGDKNMSYYDQNEIVENIKSYNRYNDRDKVYPKAFDGERNPTYWYSYDHQDGTRVIVQEVKSEKKYNYLVGMFPTSSDICNSADVLFIRGKNQMDFMNAMCVVDYLFSHGFEL